MLKDYDENKLAELVEVYSVICRRPISPFTGEPAKLDVKKALDDKFPLMPEGEKTIVIKTCLRMFNDKRIELIEKGASAEERIRVLGSDYNSLKNFLNTYEAIEAERKDMKEIGIEDPSYFIVKLEEADE